MRCSRFTPLFLALTALAACDAVNTPTKPSPSAGPLLGKGSVSLTRATFAFTNLTGQTTSRLVIQFNAPIVGVPYAPTPTYTVSGSTLTLDGLATVSNEDFVATVTVEGKSIRVERWYWAAPDGTVLGTIAKGCSSRQACSEIVIDGFRLATPYIQIMPFQEIGYCYYFRTPNATTMAVRAWKAKLGPAALRANVILSETDVQRAWTQSAANCTPIFSPQNATNFKASWAFTAYPPADSLVFPSDDGTGTPVGMIVPTERSGYVYVHYANLTSAPVTTRVEIEAVPYDRGTVITPANSYLTYNTNINLAPGEFKTYSQKCAVPQGAKFFWMSTYSYKQTVLALLKDSAFTLLTVTDPYAPGVATFKSPFYSLAGGAITYQFSYLNNTNRTITSGPSPAADESGIALTYYFPATDPKYCINSSGPL
ncbi:MAG: hypothetical protein ABIP93_16230 [Gemmatimonadaceae bacterium]